MISSKNNTILDRTKIVINNIIFILKNLFKYYLYEYFFFKLKTHGTCIFTT